jgi:hypothetical protein
MMSLSDIVELLGFIVCCPRHRAAGYRLFRASLMRECKTPRRASMQAGALENSLVIPR